MRSHTQSVPLTPPELVHSMGECLVRAVRRRAIDLDHDGQAICCLVDAGFGKSQHALLTSAIDWARSVLTTDRLKASAVALANEVRATLTGSFAEVQALLDRNQIVFAIWSDRAEPDGVGMLIVKGHSLLRDVCASGIPQQISWTAIPCTCAEQAVALRQVAGEPDGSLQ